MKKGLIIILYFISQISNSQTTQLNYKSIEDKLLVFLNQNGDIRDNELNEFKTGKFGLFFQGVYNESRTGNLAEGLYTFSVMATNTHLYYLIIENNQISILNISSKKGLNESVVKFLDFADRKRYCSKITGDAISKIISTYYQRNRDTSVAADVNCEKGINDIKKLP